MMSTVVRGSALAVACAVLTTGLWELTRPVLAEGAAALSTPAPAGADAAASVVTAAAAALLLAAWTWLSVTAALITVDVLRGRRLERARWAVPATWHRIVTGFLGVGLACAPVAAGADSRGHDQGRRQASTPALVIDGLSLPDRPTGRTQPAAVHRVVAGDSLWSVAREHLPPHATDRHIAAAWPRWYAANADAIGTDPDLITPGTLLRAPEHPDPLGGHS